MSVLRISVTVICLAHAGYSAAQKTFDSLGLRLPKHYFNTVISAEGYRKPSVALDTASRVGRRLGRYGIRQFSFSFYTPVYTKVFRGDDSTLRNVHVLLTANFVSLRPQFEKVPVHNLVKSGLGVRVIYNTGRKLVWFVDASPFVTRDMSHPSTLYRRFATTVVMSVNESASFNWRIGITKSFMWGNRYYLPYLGIRFGRLDKVNLSIQVPRSIQLNMPVNNNFIVSLFTRPQGGMFIYANTDSVYFRTREKDFHFTRYEIITGIRFDIRFKQTFSCFLSGGLSTANNLTFYSEPANTRLGGKPYQVFFFRQNTAPTLFVNLGATLRFGRTRTSLNDRNLYDAIDIINDGKGNLQIPVKARQKSRANIKDIQDLVDYNDL